MGAPRNRRLTSKLSCDHGENWPKGLVLVGLRFYVATGKKRLATSFQPCSVWGPHPVMVRGYSWLGDHMGRWGIELLSVLD